MTEPLRLHLPALSLQPDELRVVSFSGTEALSRLYAIDVVAQLPSSLDPSDLPRRLLGTNAAIDLDPLSARPRRLSGIIGAIEVGGPIVQGWRPLRAKIVPRLWRLRKRRQSRVFQGLSAPEVVAAVLDRAGIPYQMCLTQPAHQYPARDYCVQYKETDDAFISRLLAEAGIAFYFEQRDAADFDATEASAERVIFIDSAETYPALGGDPSLIYRYSPSTDAMSHGEDHVHRFVARQAIASASIALRDYDVERPAAFPSASALAPTSEPHHDPTLHVYDHPDTYAEADIDPAAAKIQLQQLRRKAQLAAGSTSCRRLAPGHTFRLSDHDDDDLNRDYVVTKLIHEAYGADGARRERPVYEARFECAPASICVRPGRPRRRERHVTETAIVCGPSGQEIYTDARGRIRVQFHWDLEGGRDERSSCWMRVMQAWAGAGWGFQFIPRVGMEVLVTFIGGDPDQPIVIGAVNNAVTPVSHPLPQQQTRSGIRTQSTPGGGGANELLFEDQAGLEQIIVTAQRDLNETIRVDHSTSVGKDQTLTVAANQSETIGANQTQTVGGDQTRTIGGDRHETVTGSESARIMGSRDVTVLGFEHHAASQAMRSVETTYDLHVGQAFRLFTGRGHEGAQLELQSTSDVAIGAGEAARVVAQTSIELICGQSRIVMTPEGIRFEAKKVDLHGLDAANVRSKATSISGGVEIAGKTVRVVSEGASLVLDTNANLDGALVKLNCADTGADGPKGELGAGKQRLSLRLFQGGYEPYASKKYKLVADGEVLTGTTSPDGLLEEQVSDKAQSCALTLWTHDYPEGPTQSWTIALSALAPCGEVRGAQQRLRNLGYYSGEIGDELDAPTVHALKKFQTDNRLDPTGEIDALTITALTELHGY